MLQERGRDDSQREEQFDRIRGFRGCRRRRIHPRSDLPPVERNFSSRQPYADLPGGQGNCRAIEHRCFAPDRFRPSGNEVFQLEDQRRLTIIDRRFG
jgi:hypothetical protein